MKMCGRDVLSRNAMLVMALAAVVVTVPVQAGNEAPVVSVKEVPAGAEAAARDTWKTAVAGSRFAGGAALENGRIVVVAAVGGEGIMLLPADRNLKGSALITPFTAGKETGKITGVRLDKQDETEASLKVSFGGADLNVAIRLGQLQAIVNPGKGVGSVEVAGEMKYVVMPDFFGHDVVFNPRQLKSEMVTPPAENFLLNMIAGSDSIVMCAWQGPLSLSKEKKAGAAAGKTEEKDPRVDLMLSGRGADRMVKKTRHECDGKPLYVALLAKKGIWYEKDLAGVKAQVSTELDWKRPYEAKWRAIFLGKEGTFCGEFMVKDVTWDVTYDTKDWARRGDDGAPGMWWQGEWRRFTVPAYIPLRAPQKTFISVYADSASVAEVKKVNDALRAEAKTSGKPFAAVAPTNTFETVILYASDRRPETPLDEKLPTDVMRDCLGIGPCEYVLDLEGMKETTTRNGHYVHPTCHTFDNWISRFGKAAAGKDSDLPDETRNGRKGIPLAGLKAGEKFKPEDEAILIERLEDFAWFTGKINVRLHQYQDFAKNMVKFCNEESAKNPALKPVADEVVREGELLLKQCSDKTLEGMTRQRDEWKVKVDKVIEEVKAGNYANVNRAGDIRGYAEPQDNLMGICHRLTKGMRQAASTVDSPDPAVAAFAGKVRALSHEMLRSKGHFEY